MKDLSRLVSRQYNNHNSKHYFCNIVYMAVPVKRYWKTIWEDVSYTERKESIFQKLTTRREMTKFTKTEYQLRSPFVIYANFKSVLHKQDLCEPSSSKSFTTQYQQHVPYGSYIYVKYSDGRHFEAPQVNIGDDAAENFLDQGLAAASICRQHLANKISTKWLTQEQWREYNNATNCSICAKPFNSADKKPATAIIWQVNIEVQLIMHATWITASIQRKWKFHASFATSKEYCF